MSQNRDDRYATAHHFQLALEEAMPQTETVRSRDLGRYVADVFAETREEIKAVIEEQMSLAAQTSSANIEGLEPVALPNWIHGAAIPRSLGSEEHERGAGEVGSRRPLIVLLSIALVVAVALLGWMRLEHRRAAPAPIAVTLPATAPIPSATAPPVEVLVIASPPQALIFLDDATLPTNPFTIVHAKDGSGHVLHAEAPGYEPQSVELTFDRDSRLELALQKASPPVPPQRPERAHSGHAAPPPAAALSTSAPAKPNCSQPYYFDEQGIKKIRSECL